MIEQVEQIVAGHFGVSVENMKAGKSRRDNDARHFLWYFLHCVLGFRGSVIAKTYGVAARNVYYYSSLIKDGLSRERFYTKNCMEIQAKLKDVEIL